MIAFSSPTMTTLSGATTTWLSASSSAPMLNCIPTGSTAVSTTLWQTTTQQTNLLHQMYVAGYQQGLLVQNKQQLSTGDYHLPDGAILTIDDNGNYQIDDSDAKIIYRANRNRNFNEFVNVSDVLDQFMRYIAGLKLSRDEFMALPISLFIIWLIIEAAKADGDPEPEQEVKQLQTGLAEISARPKRQDERETPGNEQTETHSQREREQDNGNLKQPIHQVA